LWKLSFQSSISLKSVEKELLGCTMKNQHRWELLRLARIEKKIIRSPTAPDVDIKKAGAGAELELT
jgi:hypothetical protein